MGSKRYTSKELRKMSLKSLAEVGDSLGLTFTKNHSRFDRAKKILALYATQDASTPDAMEDISKHDISSNSPPSNLHEPKPRFEQLCSEGIQPSEPTSEGRGGAREGSGRPPGLTNELALYQNLPQFPHPAIQHCLEILFETWSVRAKCPVVALTKDQALALALPYTQAAYLAGILDYIPAWAMVGIELVWTTWNMISVKAALAREAAAGRKKVESKEVASEQAAK